MEYQWDTRRARMVMAMSECKALCDAGCSLVFDAKPCAERDARRGGATPAPVGRQAGGLNTHRDPSPKNSRTRSCYNKSYSLGYWVLTRKWFDDGRFELVNEWIPHRTSTDCRYDLMASDPECVGCKWRKV